MYDFKVYTTNEKESYIKEQKEELKEIRCKKQKRVYLIFEKLGINQHKLRLNMVGNKKWIVDYLRNNDNTNLELIQLSSKKIKGDL